MTSIREVEWEACLLEPRPNREFEDRFRRETGRPGGLMRFFEGSSWVCDAVVRLSVQLNTHVGVDADLVDQTGLVVSQDNSCRFCFGAQRVFLRALGMSERKIGQLEQDILVGESSDRDKAVLRYARRFSRSQPLVDESDVETLHAVGFDDTQIMELTGHVALHLFFNRMSTFIALPPERLESMPDAWWMRFGRPLVKPFFMRMRKTAGRVALAPEERDGAYRETVNALDGLPMAGAWRASIDAALASETLSPLAAPLAFAVIARTLGCADSEDEAIALLDERGLPSERARAALATLSGEGLEEIDHLVALFARETVWYLPARIQQRCQSLSARLSREQLLELIGIVSLANSVCRLGVIKRSRAR